MAASTASHSIGTIQGLFRDRENGSSTPPFASMQDKSFAFNGVGPTTSPDTGFQT